LERLLILLYLFFFEIIFEISIDDYIFFSPSHAGSAGWLHALFPVMVFAEKSKYTEALQEKSALHHRKLAFT
jgi:hypothetical protein